MDHTRDTAAQPLSPRRIGRYEITGELGRGSMGIVYKGFDPSLGRHVAVKIVQLTGHDEDLIRRFRREAQAAGVLNHPNIVTIYDAGEDQGIFYIAMEYVQGDPLDKIILGGPLALDMIKRIVEDVGSALDLAHEKEIIHRDIKPANIMIAGGRAKIMDFGVAKLASSTATATGTLIGTPSYLSPEAVKGQPIDNRADIFSLGVVLYEMLTGKRPFAGDNLASVMYKIVGEHPEPPSRVNPRVPKRLDAVLAKALAKDPQERYQTCTMLTLDLKNSQWFAAPAKPAEALPASPALAASAPSHISVAKPAATPRAAPKARPEQAYEPPPPSPPEPRGLPWIVPAAIVGAIALAVIGFATWGRYRMNAERERQAQAAQAAAENAKVEALLAHPVKPKPKPAAPDGTVEVMVKANVNGATISVDGKTDPSWRTPHKVRMELGAHLVEVSKEGFRPSKRIMTVNGDEGEVHFRLAPLPGGNP